MAKNRVYKLTRTVRATEADLWISTQWGEMSIREWMAMECERIKENGGWAKVWKGEHGDLCILTGSKPQKTRKWSGTGMDVIDTSRPMDVCKVDEIVVK